MTIFIMTGKSLNIVFSSSICECIKDFPGQRSDNLATSEVLDRFSLSHNLKPLSHHATDGNP